MHRDEKCPQRTPPRDRNEARRQQKDHKETKNSSIESVTPCAITCRGIIKLHVLYTITMYSAILD